MYLSRAFNAWGSVLKAEAGYHVESHFPENMDSKADFTIRHTEDKNSRMKFYLRERNLMNESGDV